MVNVSAVCCTPQRSPSELPVLDIEKAQKCLVLEIEEVRIPKL